MIIAVIDGMGGGIGAQVVSALREAVSYTHLDVYKRQEKYSNGSINSSICFSRGI